MLTKVAFPKEILFGVFVAVQLIRCLLTAVRFLTGDCDLSTLRARVDASKFRGKTVWVTGASGGIGRSLCEQISRYGARLIISGRDESTLCKVQDSLVSNGASVTIAVIDLDTESLELEQAALRIVRNHGPVDILVNNAGVSTRADSVSMDLSVLTRVLRINYLAPIILARACIPDVGMIINTLSIASLVRTPLRSAYSGSKSGVWAYFACMELEYSGVEICNVFPGSTKTNIAHNALTDNGARFDNADPNIENGLPAHRVADRILAAASDGIRNAVIATPKELLAVRLALWFPSLWHFISIRRAEGYRKRMLSLARS